MKCSRCGADMLQGECSCGSGAAVPQKRAVPTFFCRSWTAAKRGSRPEQNEDACRSEPFSDRTSKGLLLALADGATEAVYSGPWARALVAAAEPDWPTLDDKGLNERLDQVRQRFAPFPAGQAPPWYVRNKYLLQGSQATLLVATVVGTSKGPTVRAVSVGDSCLLLVRESGLSSFPVKCSADFGTSPGLVGSRRQPGQTWERWEADLTPGDLLLGCTDALAKWALECAESAQRSQLFELLAGLLGLSPLLESSSAPAVKSSLHSGWLRRLLGQFPKKIEKAPAPRCDLSQFIEQHSTPGSKPRLRNDDCTLLVCLPMTAATEAEDDRVRTVLQKHYLVTRDTSATPRSAAAPSSPPA